MASDDQTNSEAIASQIGNALTGLFGEASPSALFSEPISHGDDLIVTALLLGVEAVAADREG